MGCECSKKLNKWGGRGMTWDILRHYTKARQSEIRIFAKEKEIKSKQNVQNQVSESKSSSTMEESIFARIREYDEKQWKNSEKSENSNSSQDY